jgi:hypothetical protein
VSFCQPERQRQQDFQPIADMITRITVAAGVITHVARTPGVKNNITKLPKVAMGLKPKCTCRKIIHMRWQQDFSAHVVMPRTD